MTHSTRATLRDRVDQAIFDAIYSRALVYNTCWEDPAIDRQVLNISPDDRMLVITSAGCNVLDYALLGPQRIDAVDANPRQNALLELKLAGIRALEFEDFFAAFGRGYHGRFQSLYREQLRPLLSPFARAFWDRRVIWFGNPRGSFYFHGLSGIVARGIEELFETRSLEEQRDVYERRVQPLIWSPEVNWTLSRQLTMSMLGVPHPQRKEVQNQHELGVAGFVRDSIDYVFRQLPAWTNYFWTLYVRGHYTETCCPEYLKPEQFAALKAGLADRVRLHTKTVSAFLAETEEPVSKFVLLDHMDWMSSYHPGALAEEWSLILQRARSEARIIFRSAHEAPRWLEALELGPARTHLRDHLQFQPELAAAMQPMDRVHTYAGFHIADVRA